MTLSEQRFESLFLHRPMLKRDIPEVNQLGADAGFDDGELNFELYFEQSPRRWEVVVERSSGQIVAYHGVIMMPNGLQFGALIYTLPRVRGLGVTRCLGRDMKGNFIANSSSFSIARYAKAIDIISYKVLIFTGSVNVQHCSKGIKNCVNVSIKPLTEDLLAAVLEYDALVLPDAGRERFLGEWMMSRRKPAMARSFVAVDIHDRVVGIGTLRQRRDLWTLSPLYADSSEIALSLTTHLIESFQSERFTMYIACSANCFTMTRMARELSLCVESVYYHNYSDSKKVSEFHEKIQFDRIFAFIEMYPV